MDVSSLFNVLVSTFAVMLLGFLLPKLEMVDRVTVGKGLGGLIGKLLLPAVLFKQMANLEIGSLDRKVVLSMLLAKVPNAVSATCGQQNTVCCVSFDLCLFDREGRSVHRDGIAVALDRLLPESRPEGGPRCHHGLQPERHCYRARRAAPNV